MATKVQLTIYADDQTTATGTGPIADPDVIAAARIVLDHLADNAAGITKEVPAEPVTPDDGGATVEATL